MNLENVATDYSQLCNVNLEKKLENVNKSVDNMLTRLEEFQTMVTFVQQDREDSTHVLESLSNLKDEFNNLCSRIDRVESLVSHITNNLNSLEEDVGKKEEEFGCTEAALKVSNIFTPLFKKTSDSKNLPEKLAVFKTEDYFK